MVTAVPQDQWRLLDLQAHDTRLTQLAHKRRTLPAHAEVDRLNGQLRQVADQLVAVRTVASDVARELTKAEADVELVRQRASRDRARLDSGHGSAKDLQAIQHELESLAQRQSALEDVELEVMERLEAVQARVAEVEGEQERLAAELAEATAHRDRLVTDVDDEANLEQQARANCAAGLPADLLALYEKVRESAGGVGAARLYQRRCEGCRLELNMTDINRIRAAADDTVVRCEECRRILVRTPDSGL